MCADLCWEPRKEIREGKGRICALKEPCQGNERRTRGESTGLKVPEMWLVYRYKNRKLRNHYA